MLSTIKTPAGGLLAALLLSTPALPQDARALFHEAYYLEHEGGRLEEAHALYAKVAAARGGDAELRARASERAAGLAEEFAALDMARLVPADTIFFAQMDRPGAQLALLLDQLGLLGEAHRIAEQKIAISPLLIEHLLGLRGAAVAITDLDPRGEPSGVVMLHPGSHDGLRGLIDTALPAMGERIDPIAGFPSWSVEGEATVSLTRRMLVAGRDREGVAAVLGRIANGGGDSLADDPRFTRARTPWEGDHGSGLVSFYLNADPLKPMIHAMLERETHGDPGAAMAMNLLDLDSFDSLSGRLGVDDEGLGLNLALELAEGHRNLVFNLMRRPTVTSETLELVPEGAAFFLATAFNPEADVAPIERDQLDQPVVTALDFGRELFGNVVDVAVFGMPDGGDGPIPDLSLVLRVNDAERSRALWGLCLGMVNTAAGGDKPAVESFAGASVTRYSIEGVPLYMAAKADRLVLSPNRESIERALGGGYARSIGKDEVLGGALAALDDSPTFLLAACPGRLAKMARPFVPEREYAQMQPVAELLADTSVTLLSQHSATRLALAARVENVPDVSPLLEQAVKQHRQAWRRGGDQLQVVHGGWKARGHDEARAVAEHTESMDDLRAKFDALVETGERDRAVGLAQRMVATVEDAKGLNNLAWALLTEEGYDGGYDVVARILSIRSNELTDHSNWAYMDTLALAEHRSGNHARAVELQERAIELLGKGAAKRPEVSEALERYRAALENEGLVSR